MERIILKDIVLEDTHFEKLHIFLDDLGNVIILPMIWAMQIAINSSVYSWHKRASFSSSRLRFNGRSSPVVEKSFELNPVTINTAENYLGHVFQFLKYINELSKSSDTPSLHSTELVSSRLINLYLNDVLPQRLKSSTSLNSHQAAISAYYSFLHELEIKDVIFPTIHRKTRQLMADSDCRPKKISYVSRAERTSLLQACNSMRDRLLIRMGFEVGLRTEENKGLVLNDFKAKNSTHKGLLSLFTELNRFPSKQSFEFVLNGKYTKGGKTRTIYFDRELLIALKNYYDTERITILQLTNRVSNSLFIRSDNQGAGLPINSAQGSNTFNTLLKRCPEINQTLSYHDLRHTFATELYHSELINNEGRETRSESAALIVVCERLGHKSTTTTRRYIRLRQQMLIIEEGSNAY